MPISFLILTYNSAPYIIELLDSIFMHLEESVDSGQVEIIVLDNASTDTTLKKVNAYGKKINVKKSDSNLGYAKGINLAATYAKGEILVVINPDSKLIKFDQSKIIAEFANSNNLAVSGFEISNFNGKRELTAGRFYNPISFLMFALGLEKIAGIRFAPLKRQHVDFVSGGFIAFRKSAFEELNGYDKDYFMYVEDMDICFRAFKKDMDVLFLPFAKIEHIGQGSSNREFAIVNIFKGIMIFTKKHNSIVTFMYMRNLLRIKAALIIFVSVITGNKEKLATYRKALKAI